MLDIKKHDGTTLLVFGKVEAAPDSFSLGSYIGINLDDGEVDSISGYASTVYVHDMPKEQLIYLADSIQVLLALQEGILAISAKARSGKDYLAEQVLDFFPAVHLALGAPIKEACAVIFGRPKKGKNRSKLVKLGQTARNWIDPDIWIKAWLRQAITDFYEDGITNFVVPDVRQPNEFSFFKSLGATMVVIKANEDSRLEKIAELDGAADLSPELLNDETEQNIDGFVEQADFVIDNNYDDQFKKDIDNVLVGHLIIKGWPLDC